MPHALHDYRDAIDALVGPIEELISKANATLPVGGPSDQAYLRAFVVGGLEQALEMLTDAVSDIDGFEEEEPEDGAADAEEKLHDADEEVENEFDEDEIDDAAR